MSSYNKYWTRRCKNCLRLPGGVTEEGGLTMWDMSWYNKQWTRCKNGWWFEIYIASIAETKYVRTDLWWHLVMKGGGGIFRVNNLIPAQTAVSCLIFRAHHASTMTFSPLIGVLFISVLLQPVSCGWADMLRTTTPTTPNPDKPGARLMMLFFILVLWMMVD